MVSPMPPASWDPDERDWRLHVELAQPAARGMLARIVEHLHDPSVMSELRSAVAENAVITHDGAGIFAYAAGRPAIEQAQSAIASVLARDAIQARSSLSHWDGELDAWIDPDDHSPASQRARQAARSTESRTLVVRVGREIREEFEQSMRNWAEELGLRCEILEHPHLLEDQVAFTVTGPARKLDEFASGMKAEQAATIRTEYAVMTSPL